MSFDRLDQLCRRLDALDHAQAMLGVDEAVMMPEGSGAARAAAMAEIAALQHETATQPAVADWLASAEARETAPDRVAALAEFRRVHRNLTCLSSDFVARQVKARMAAEQLWRGLRARNDWQGFLPAFSEVVALAREEAARRAEVLQLSPYDALMEQFDPGNRTSDVTPVFQTLKTFLVGFIPRAMAAQARRRGSKAMRGPFPVARQKALGQAVMAALGFDFGHGRLDVSHHPFCGGVPDDVRMTTRYRTDEFLSSLMGMVHETGHGLYEQGLPRAWRHWPVGKARGMALHESQSLLVEMQLARRGAFWKFALPLARKHLGSARLAGVTTAGILSRVQRVKPGLIRVDADEATYPLHIMLRYEIEQALIAGALLPRDVPEAWDAKMQESLGLDTRGNFRDGPMQDVHWPSGAFGYFPSYTLGALAAAQQFAAIRRALPEVETDIAKGNFSRINDWRRHNIWEKASFHSTQEIMRQATGEALSPRAFMAHLEERYL